MGRDSRQRPREGRVGQTERIEQQRAGHGQPFDRGFARNHGIRR